MILMIELLYSSVTTSNHCPLILYHTNSTVPRAINQSATLLALFSVGDPSPTSCTSDLLRDEEDLADVAGFFLSSPPSLLSESLLELFVLSESLSEVKSLSSPGLGGDSGESGSKRRAWIRLSCLVGNG